MNADYSYDILLYLDSYQPILHYLISSNRIISYLADECYLAYQPLPSLRSPPYVAGENFFTFWFLWSFQQSWSLSVLVSNRIIQACKNYTKKYVKSQKYPKWAIILRFLFQKVRRLENSTQPLVVTNISYAFQSYNPGVKNKPPVIPYVFPRNNTTMGIYVGYWQKTVWSVKNHERKMNHYNINHQKLKIFSHPRYSSWLLINDLLALLTEQVLIVFRLFVCICAGANST